MDVKQFYNEISKEYSDLLDKAVPKYREMLSTLLYYIPDRVQPKSILELGCGTGNLTAYLVKAYPYAEITVVDIASEMLEACKQRFSNHTNIIYHQADFKHLNFEVNSFDLVISSIAIHHLEDEHKKILFKSIFDYLSPQGIFTYADQCKGRTDEIYEKHIMSWKTEAFKLGSTQDNWETWMKHQKNHDFHATINDQLMWLEDASFHNIDVIWRNLLWTIFYAEKINLSKFQ